MRQTEAIAEVDSIFDRFAAAEPAPGVVFGIVIGGELVHARGLGTLQVGVDVLPDSDSVFRIASMTKSFTAAAVLLLRDRGRLRLDDAVSTWVPELADLARATADSPSITIEHLLTMSAGFPTDDPWGDRQQGLDPALFAAFLREGISLAWAPGTRFEYSNLGYGILGRVITAAAGVEYRDFVGDELLVPLGMNATTFVQEDVPVERLALGYLRRDGAWLEEPIDPYGALASMGGIFTSISDLARWVAGFTDAFPARDDPDEGHPLRRASRREMQQIHRAIEPELTWTSADAAPIVGVGGYGYGLGVTHDLRFGRIVEHGGGYPGYGSNMRWQPASGIGILAFGNARYAPIYRPVREALVVLLAAEAAPLRRVVAWRQRDEARTAVEQLLEHWDDATASRLFAMNVELDEPLTLRRAAMEQLHDLHGTLRADESALPQSASPAHVAWWMTGERGRVHVEILLSPERLPRVQSLKLTSVPDPSASLTAHASRLVALLAEPSPAWPSDLPLASPADRIASERALRVAAARFGPVVLGRSTAGDGEKTATWCLSSDHGELDLRVELDVAGGRLIKAGFVPRPMQAPTLAD